METQGLAQGGHGVTFMGSGPFAFMGPTSPLKNYWKLCFVTVVL